MGINIKTIFNCFIVDNSNEYLYNIDYILFNINLVRSNLLELRGEVYGQKCSTKYSNKVWTCKANPSDFIATYFNCYGGAFKHWIYVFKDDDRRRNILSDGV